MQSVFDINFIRRVVFLINFPYICNSQKAMENNVRCKKRIL